MSGLRITRRVLIYKIGLRITYIQAFKNIELLHKHMISNMRDVDSQIYRLQYVTCTLLHRPLTIISNKAENGEISNQNITPRTYRAWHKARLPIENMQFLKNYIKLNTCVHTRTYSNTY